MAKAMPHILGALDFDRRAEPQDDLSVGHLPAARAPATPENHAKRQVSGSRLALGAQKDHRIARGRAPEAIKHIY